MVNFLKEYSYSIFKMFVNQLVMTFFGLALSASTAMNDNLFFASSVLAIGLYLVLLFTMTWEIGYSEKAKIDGKRLAYKPLKGLWMSLIANIPNFFIGIAITVSYYTASSYTANAAGIKFPSAPQASADVFGITKSAAALLEGMYAGTVNKFFLNSPWIYIVIIVPSLLVCTAAYIMGVRGKYFTKLLAPKGKMD